MTIERYEELTGQTVSASDENLVQAAINRATVELEAALGYSLDLEKNIYSELGKTQYEGYTVGQTLPVPQQVIDNLLPADEPIGDVRVFPLQLKDKFALVQPFDTAYRAKVVLVTSTNEFITLVDLEGAVPQTTGAGWGKWVEVDVPGWSVDPVAIANFLSLYAVGHWKQVKLALALDADYHDVASEPAIEYLLADMVDYRLDPNNSAANGNIKSESVDGHSWSKGETVVTPIDSVDNKSTVALFAGPNGSKRNRVPVK